MENGSRLPYPLSWPSMQTNVDWKLLERHDSPSLALSLRSGCVRVYCLLIGTLVRRRCYSKTRRPSPPVSPKIFPISDISYLFVHSWILFSLSTSRTQIATLYTYTGAIQHSAKNGLKSEYDKIDKNLRRDAIASWGLYAGLEKPDLTCRRVIASGSTPTESRKHRPALELLLFDTEMG